MGESGNRYRDSVLLARMAATFLKSAVDSPRDLTADRQMMRQLMMMRKISCHH
ncbi:WSSV564 [White spot syndrome virus]|uniref:WSSV564 n=1 Tax=White spot syndrome virus TaxID=342409 RepID=A0A2I6SCK5_9VIRU|nr:WSSV564 [White spot syndrome virus]